MAAAGGALLLLLLLANNAGSGVVPHDQAMLDVDNDNDDNNDDDAFVLTPFWSRQQQQQQQWKGTLRLPRRTTHALRRRQSSSSSLLLGLLSTAAADITSSTEDPPEPHHLHHPTTSSSFAFRGLYPPATQIRTGTLRVDGVHTLYYEIHSSSSNNHTTTSSSPSPRPPTALVLHGGPGAGCYARHATLFDTTTTTVVLLDQRGSGRSTPRGEFQQGQTLADLVQDCERLRRHLLMMTTITTRTEWDEKIGAAVAAVAAAAVEKDTSNGEPDPPEPEPWDIVLGGSWGCTLALAYVAAHPYAMKSILLRGICTMRRVEIDWLLASTNNAVGARHYFPQAWKEFATAVNCPPGENNNNNNNDDPRAVLHAYYDRLLGDDPVLRWNACRSLMKWEMTVFASSSSSSSLSSNNPSNTTTATMKNSSTSIPMEEMESKAAPVAVWDAASGQWSMVDGKSGGVLNEDALHQMDFFSSSSSSSSIESTVQDLRVGLHQLIHDTTSTAAAAITEARPVSSIHTTSTTATAPTLLVQNNLDSNQTSNSTASSSSSSSTTSAPNATAATTEPHSEHNYIPAQQMLTCFYSVNDRYALNHNQVDLLSTAISQMVRHQIPCIAVQGGLDRVCPPDTALDLLRLFQQQQQQQQSHGSTRGSLRRNYNTSTLQDDGDDALLELRIPMQSGHSMYDPAITNELVRATERMAERLRRATTSIGTNGNNAS